MPDILLIEDDLGVQEMLCEWLINQGSGNQICPERGGRLV